MKTFFLTGIIIATSIFAAGQQNKAKQILDEVSQKTRSYNTISARFIFTMDND